MEKDPKCVGGKNATFTERVKAQLHSGVEKGNLQELRPSGLYTALVTLNPLDSEYPCSMAIFIPVSEKIFPKFQIRTQPLAFLVSALEITGLMVWDWP